MKKYLDQKIGKKEKIHFIGIGGSGMSGIASVLCDLGYDVSGSDIIYSSTVKNLEDKGITVKIGHHKKNILGKDILVISSAIDKKNVELKEGLKLNIPVIQRAQMLAELMRFNYGVAIAGTHGKTTTTSILVHILCYANFDPTYIIGGKILNSKSSSLGSSEYLIAEADESDASFLNLTPNIAVITNIDNDHLINHDNSFDKLKDNFIKFSNNIPFYGKCIINKSDKNILKIEKKIYRKKISFSVSRKANYMVTKIKNNFLSSEFIVKEKKKKYAVTLNIPGFHNIENALAAIATAREMGVNIKDIQNSIPSFLGIKRRFELLGEYKVDQNSFYWIDDYGHHPTEILAVYNSVKEIWPKRKILVVFQPHRYSRTKDLSKEFKKTFSKIDELIILDIYAASEKNKDKIDINKMFKENLSTKKAIHVKGFKNLEKYLLKNIQNEYVLITMGAGDISKFVLSFKNHKKVIKI